MGNLDQGNKKVYCGVDFHKVMSVIYALDQLGHEKLEVTKVRTTALRKFLANKEGWVIGIEATGGCNHVVEGLKEDGHEVVIINPNQFRGIGIGGKKTDSRDAKALANALRLGFVPQVHHRSRLSREIKSLMVSREHLVHARVNAINHIRGTLREYGLTIDKGAEAFYSQAYERIEKLKNAYIRSTLQILFENVRNYLIQEEEVDAKLREMTKDTALIEKLQSIPGVGPMTAMMMVAVVDDIKRFKNAKEFSSYLGLTPSVSASANKTMMGSITRSGSEILRRYLIHGARAWLRYNPEGDPNRSWAERVKDRRGMNKATVALAHRLSRICFAVMRDNSEYKANYQELKNVA